MKNNHFMPNEPSRFTTGHIEKLLEHSSSLSASDITFQTNEPIYAEVYGKLLPLTNRKLSNTEIGDILNHIYGPNGTAQILSGADIDTHYEFKPNRTERLRYRVNATGCMVEGHDAIQITLRTIPTTPPRLSELGLPPDILEAIAPTEGVVYITGSTGSGKSTLLSSIIRELIEDEQSHRKVLTYEAPIEFVYDEIDTVSAVVSQSEVPRHIESFAHGVRNALRRKPGLILVGECRDTETISALLEAAMTGHPVYTTLHTSGVSETVRRLVSSFPREERRGRAIDIIETIRLCIWQKLVPTVDGKRVALREYLVFNENIRDTLMAANIDNITDATRKLVREHGRLMSVDAEEKFTAGIISERDYQLIIKGNKASDS